jgi:hypothetical protein
LPISLAAGPSSRRVNILVIAQDTITNKSYAVDINVAAPSSNANLSSLSVTPGGSCNVSITSCTVSVSSTTTQVTITATKADPAANMTGAVTAPPGTASGQSTPPLTGPGPFQFSITVTAQAGNSNTYTINITRLPSNNAGLQNLQVFAGATPTPPAVTLTPSFSAPGQTLVPYATATSNTQVTIVVTKSDSNATISGAVVSASGQATGQATITLGLTNPTQIQFVVTPPSGAADAKTYRIDVTKTP